MNIMHNHCFAGDTFQLVNSSKSAVQQIQKQVLLQDTHIVGSCYEKQYHRNDVEEDDEGQDDQHG